MENPVPGSSLWGSGDDPHESSPSGSEPRARGFTRVADFFLPPTEAFSLHTAVVAAVLVLDAILVVVLAPGVSGVTSAGPALYLVMPAAAALYMSLVLVSSYRTQGLARDRFPVVVFAPLSLAWAIALVGLIALSTGSFGSIAPISSSPWLYPASLVGVALPLAGLWFGQPGKSGYRSIGLGAALLPPLIAMAVRPVVLSAETTAALTSGTLVVAAVLFQLSGFFLGRSTSEGRSSTESPTELRAPASRDGLSAPVPGRPHPGASSAAPISSPVARGGSSLDRAPPPRPFRSTGRWPDVVSTGFVWLDHLLLGGFPRRGQLALVGPAGLGSENLVWGMLGEGLRRGESIVIVSASWSVREIAEQMERFRPGFTEYDRRGKVIWVDASGRGSAARTNPPAILGPGDCVRILGALRSAAREADRKSPLGFCLGFLGVSSLLDEVGDKMGLAVLRNTVAILRGLPVVATYAIDVPDRPRPAVASILEELDGIVHFQSTNGSPALKVSRLGPVETRAWVECRYREHRGESADRTAFPERPPGRAPSSEPYSVVP
jgi:KaiC